MQKDLNIRNVKDPSKKRISPNQRDLNIRSIEKPSKLRISPKSLFLKNLVDKVKKKRIKIFYFITKQRPIVFCRGIPFVSSPFNTYEIAPIRLSARKSMKSSTLSVPVPVSMDLETFIEKALNTSSNGTKTSSRKTTKEWKYNGQRVQTRGNKMDKSRQGRSSFFHGKPHGESTRSMTRP
jgi:hypothetical protein